MYSPDLCLPLTNESVPSSFLGFTAPILVAHLPSVNAYFYLTDAYFSDGFCVYVSLWYLNMATRNENLVLFSYALGFGSCKNPPVARNKMNRETYQISFNFKSHFSFSWHFSLPYPPFEGTLHNFPLDGALILIPWFWLGLCMHLASLLTQWPFSVPPTNTIKQKVPRWYLLYGHSQIPHKYSVLELNSRLSFERKWLIRFCVVVEGGVYFGVPELYKWRRKWQPTPVFLPGESQGQGSLVGCHLWGHTESDATEVTQQQQLYKSKLNMHFSAMFNLYCKI